jgi:hypothetical protein
LRSPAVEIFIGTENVDPFSKNIEFYLSAIGAVWGGERVSSRENNYYLTNEFDNSFYLVPTNDDNENDWGGWDFVLSQNNGGTYPVYGYGLYKLTTNESNSFFYIDFRDDRLGNYAQYSPPSYGHDIDIWIKYDDLNNEFYLKSKGTYEWGNSLANGQEMTIWSIKQKGSPSTKQFPLFLTLSNQNNHPRLSWNPYHNSNIIGYYLYRKVGNSTNKIPLSSSTTTYTDTEFDIGFPINDVAEYWVRARKTSVLESLGGNHVITQGEFIPHKKTEDNLVFEETVNEFYLSPNYPNPFNPSTNITYQLPKKGHVVLKIYNTLGKEVAELINETKEEGTYSVTFNGENLPSGLYFYKIQIGEFVEVKKMLLLK